MKKRQRQQQAVPFYSDEPAVAKGLMADKPMIQNSSLGNKPNKVVDRKPGKLSGLASFTSKTKPRAGTTAKVPAFGTKAKSPATLRMSGAAGAHRLGSKSKV
jgi:hypothetical protein